MGYIIGSIAWSGNKKGESIKTNIFAIIISFVSGYTFFNSSSMMIIIVLTTLVINEIKDMEDAEMKIYERK